MKNTHEDIPERMMEYIGRLHPDLDGVIALNLDHLRGKVPASIPTLREWAEQVGFDFFMPTDVIGYRTNTTPPE